MPEFSYYWDLPDWEPEHRHWRGPSWFGIKPDGTVEIGAAYLANMQREWGPFDVGAPASFGVEFNLFDSLGNSVWHDARYIAVGLKYKNELQNVARSWTGASIYGSYVTQSSKCQITRHISGDIVPQTPTIPIIDIPWNPRNLAGGDLVNNGRLAALSHKIIYASEKISS